jgi:hypothetical protein
MDWVEVNGPKNPCVGYTTGTNDAEERVECNEGPRIYVPDAH